MFNTEKDEVVQLYLDDIIPNRFQPREIFDDKQIRVWYNNIDNLVLSVENKGQYH